MAKFRLVKKSFYGFQEDEYFALLRKGGGSRMVMRGMKHPDFIKELEQDEREGKYKDLI